jgi:uncharacterized delta-60 repeat protein
MRSPLRHLCLLALLLIPRAVRATPGDLDTTFGTGGIVATAVASPADARAAVLQPDGRIVVAGTSGHALLLVRYDADGSLDAGFGSGGIVTTPVGDAASATGLVLQPDGKLVAAGTSTNGGQASFTLARYDDEGALEPSFGGGGIVTTPFTAAAANALARQADGKLVAAGTSTAGDGGAITLVRYEADGTVDAGFGTGGVVRTSLGANADVAYALAVQPDQKLVVGDRDSAGSFAFARYDASGTLDPTFGTGGVSSTPAFGAPCRALAIQADGRIVGVGTTVFNNYFVGVVVRVTSGGELDSAFSTNHPEWFPSGGVRTYESAYAQNYLAPNAVAVDQAGRTLLAGMYAQNAFPGVPHVNYSYSFYAARLNADGTDDPTFPWRSWAASGPVNALLLQSDDKAVAVGAGGSIEAVRFLTGPCGNGVVDAGETCDDGNGVNGDGCDGNCTPTGCGNGIVTVGESCDDGNVAGGDCCDALCAFEAAGGTCTDDGNACSDDVCNATGSCTHPANGATTCDDGDACTLVDTCVFGICQGSSPVECPTCETCAPDGGCVAAPRAACTQPSAPAVSRFKIKDTTPDKGDHVQWQWLHGATTVASFGAVPSEDYALCVYDRSGVTPTLAFRAGIPAGGECGGGSCWRPSTQGFTYKSKSRGPDGVQLLKLKAGAGNAQIRLKAAGSLLSGRPGGLPAPPLPVPLLVQLHAASGACWEATFSAPAANAAGRFDAKSD